MANHSGSYMLNDVLKRLEASTVFESLGREQAQRLVVDIVKISLEYDCRGYEVLEGIGQRLGVCDSCLKPAEELRDGVCVECSELLAEPSALPGPG